MASAKMLSFGERVRHARLTCGLSQSELARAISEITKTKTQKALISQWELGRVSNPQNATLLALSVATGFSQKWFVTGKSPERDPAPALAIADPAGKYGPKLDRAMLRRAILLACGEQTTPEGIADAAIEVFETLADEPDVPDGALKRIARMVNHRA
jgi:transcriptional regulator with XRE-family HTH domain